MNDSTEHVPFLRLWEEDAVRGAQGRLEQTAKGRLGGNGTFGCGQGPTCVAISGGLVQRGQ